MTRRNLLSLPRSAVALPALLLLLAPAACSDASPTEPPATPVVYQGEITPVEGFPDLAGGVTLALLAGGFDIEVAMQGAPEPHEDGFPWMLREGTCAEPGDFLGAWEEFPSVDLDADGRWEATVSVALSEEAEGYVVDFRRSADDLEIPLACAEVTLDPAAS